MSCVLRARGREFRVDEFLKDSPLTPVAIFRRGEPRLPLTQPKGPKCDASGFHVVASQADFSEVATQVTEATNFIEYNYMELQRLTSFPNVEKISLDFGIADRDVAAQSEEFPPKLLRLLGSLGMWLEFTMYPGEVSGESPTFELDMHQG